MIVPADALQLFEGVALLILGHAKDNSTIAQRAVGIGDDQRRVELQLVAQTLTGSAGAMRTVEGERARLDLWQADTADGTGEVLGEKHIARRLRISIGRAHHIHNHHAIAQA